ncbi:hypothetical protein GCM10027596_37400 [Nocardioides korecus]
MGDIVDVRPGPSADRSGTEPVGPAPAEPLWREAVGRALRAERRRQDRTLADVASRSGVSLPYLSEVERGRKEPSSEILGAVAGALGLRLVDLTARVTRDLAPGARSSAPLALAA